MSTTTIIEKFPAHCLDKARQALEQSHKRLVRAAAKAGQQAPSPPSLDVVREHAIMRCTQCKIKIEGLTPPATHSCPDGEWTTRLFLDLELTAERPVLAGWVFLAVVEPFAEGNLIRQVPGADVTEGELAAWRTGSVVCDHCATTRRRAETFIVRADGSDTAVPAGTYKQVGRQCLAAFLGGQSAAMIVSRLGWPDLIKAAGEDGEGGWGGGSAAQVFCPDTLLALTAAVVRLDGWCSRGQARSQDRVSTADRVLYLLTPPFDPRGDWRREVERCAPIAGDISQGKEALQWARALAGSSDYEHNLRLVARQDHIMREHVGILASAVSGYLRALSRGIDLRRSQEASAANPSSHVGTVGQKLELELEVQRVHSRETDYGALHTIIFRDGLNNLFVWHTGTQNPAPGTRFRVKGTVKEHGEYKGERQTILTRCRAVRVEESTPAAGPPV